MPSSRVSPMLLRLLHAFGATNRTRIFWAGGKPFGGEERALAPLLSSFAEVQTKESLASEEELAGIKGKANLAAAVDFMLTVAANVFIPSHGGNMAHVIKVGKVGPSCRGQVRAQWAKQSS